MNDAVTVIDIVAQVTDETESGARSAEANVSRLEKSVMNLAKEIQGMKGKSKLEIAATLKDMASKGIQNVAAAGKKIAGKVWTVTLKAADLVTAPFKKIVSLIANPIAGAAAFAGISLGAADTINTFKDFEQGMANVKAITGTAADKNLAGVIQAAKDMGISFQDGSDATETSMNILTATAKHLGETTMFSAAQAAEAMENLAMAGWKAEDITRGMPGLLDLAAAGSVDLATAADVTSSALAQFKLQANESSRVADVLAATATNSKTDIAGLGESLKMAGTTAGALGFSIEDTALTLGLMGNAGVDASSAGTSLRATLSRMSKQEGMTAEETNAMAEAMRKVGVTMTDSQGNSKSLMTIMRELRAGFKGMTEAEKAATAANLAGMNAQSGLLAIVDASDEKFEELAAAISKAEGAASEMAKVKMDTLQGSLYYLQSAAEGLKIAIGDKLRPYAKGLVDWVTAHMPDIQTAVGKGVDFVTGKIDSVIAAVKSLTGSQEWQNAETLWDKIKIAWDKLIAEPFDAWWGSTGKAWITEKAGSIGEGLGTALKSGILALLGVDAGGAVTDGLDIGKSFADGFMDGFDGSKVGEALAKAIKDGLKSLVLDAATLLPGGKDATATSGLSAAVLGYGALKTAKTGYNLYKGGKALVNDTKAVGRAIGNVTGISEGFNIFRAAQGGGSAAQSALAMAQSGALGRGMKYGAKLAGGASKAGEILSKVTGPLAGGVSKAGKFISKAAGPALAGITSAIQMGVDAYHGTQKAEEWTGSDSTGSKVASGIGAAVGGLGDGILGDESLLRKTSNVGGGALKGAGIGAAVGSILPGIGTAIGGAVGAGIGAAGAAIGGSNIAKALSSAGAAVGGFFTKTVPEKFGQFAEGAKGFFTETVPQALSSAGSAVKGFFTETVPAKFGELVDGAVGFFTETVPYAIGYAAGKVQVFFTETVPQFFGNLVEGATNFFTQTVPAAIETAGAVGFFTETVPADIETVGSAVTNFFTVSVPKFFTGLWDGVTGFFMETVPAALETVGTALNTFFTETVPNFFSGLWDGVVHFFTESIPNAISGIGETIGGFFTNVKDKITGFFGGLWDKVTGSAAAGYQAATATPHAEGGIMTRPHLGLVAEDGAEAIIPLSGKCRARGLSIWEKTGEMLGVEPYADGAIAGNAEPAAEGKGGIESVAGRGTKPDRSITDVPEGKPKPNDGSRADKNPLPPPPPEGNHPTPEWDPPAPKGNPNPANGGMSIPVTIQSLKVEINVDGSTAQNPQELAAAIREHVRGMTDDIAYQLATAMQQVFSNTPKEGWRT